MGAEFGVKILWDPTFSKVMTNPGTLQTCRGAEMFANPTWMGPKPQKAKLIQTCSDIGISATFQMSIALG